MQQPGKQLPGPESGAAPILSEGKLCPHLTNLGRLRVSEAPLRYLAWSRDGRLGAVYAVPSKRVDSKLFDALATYTAWSAGVDRRGVRVMMEVT